uniref:Large ribosomal subunit protein mL46 n=2 Tax=Timema TaxID=61471 RepID=A0A7R8Z6S9_TIMDO|nr:unnamed protein product [Timema douglasi]
MVTYANSGIRNLKKVVPSDIVPQISDKFLFAVLRSDALFPLDELRRRVHCGRKQSWLNDPIEMVEILLSKKKETNYHILIFTSVLIGFHRVQIQELLAAIQQGPTGEETQVPQNYDPHHVCSCRRFKYRNGGALNRRWRSANFESNIGIERLHYSTNAVTATQQGFKDKPFLSSTKDSKKWDLVSAVCVERKPIVTKNLTPIEEKFSKLLMQVEFEVSLKSDHEVRHEIEVKQEELLKKGDTLEIDLEQAKQTAQDFEDLCQDELNKFTFSPRTYDTGKEHDHRSILRKLDANLVLLVHQKLGKDFVWVLPQGLRSEGETLHQTAERVLKEHCGDQLNVRFFGLAPCGFYKYKYPKEVQTNSNNTPFGAKVFFFKAQYIAGSVNPSSSIQDFKWLERKTLSTNLHKDYYKSISLFLIDE